MACAAPAAKTAARFGTCSVDQTEGVLIMKYLKVFREFDTSGDGTISPSELQAALEKSGIRLTMREFRKFLAEVDTDGNNEISFQEFCDLVKQLQASQVKYKAKTTRIPRMYLTPEQFSQYASLFRDRAGDDGQLNVQELESFLQELKMTVSSDRLQAIMQEVDDDQSGYLEENEFMVLLIRAANLKKRKVGPGLCALAALRSEGWSLSELTKVGYESRDFLTAGYVAQELMDVFSVAELRKAGVSLTELLAAGWDGLHARQAGFELTELVANGCSVRKIRKAGWDDLAAAVSLRKMGFNAEMMKLGGWALSELRGAGYSAADLRLAGFSQAGLAAMQQVLSRTKGRPTLERQSTFQVRADIDRRISCKELGDAL